jgi:chromosome segregation ATPase
MQQKESIDLMNVEYEDVLQIYRGWRKSENMLKDKDKELQSLKTRIKQLQDSHSQFRNQIHALESVKELTMTLQQEVSTLQQENRQLVAENKELASLNLNAEILLKEKDHQEVESSRILKSVQLEFATLKGRYEETLKIQKELEKIASDEQATRMSAESRLKQADFTIESLKEETYSFKQKLEAANHKLNQCDQELMHASEQLSSISREVIAINNIKESLATSQAENGVLRGDITRLLKLLEYSSATRDFVEQWQSSSGMNFVGFDHDPTSVSKFSSSFAAGMGMGNEFSHDFDHGENGENGIADESKYNISPVDFAQLKRIHGRDPFPLSSSYNVS